MNTTEQRPEPDSLDVLAWRAFTPEESIAHTKNIAAHARSRDMEDPIFRSALVFRRMFSPVDVYCYLKARFGSPNGFQTFLRKDSSDNWIHWDYNIRSHNAHVRLFGTYREIHVNTSDELEDADWLELASRLKRDFSRVAAKKKSVQESLEKWVLFPNHYVEVAALCGKLHSSVLTLSKRLESLRAKAFPSFPPESEREKHTRIFNQFVHVSQRLYAESLELSLLTPVLVESFINMAILILCKRNIRENGRQFEAFIRSNIDVKVFDLAYKCDGFIGQVDGNSPEYRCFKKVMDKRNDTIHGNISPEKEKLEVIYFEKRRPLFKEPGDHLAKYFDSLSRRYDTDAVIADYENVHLFFVYIATLLNPDMRSGFWQTMESQFPGFDVNRKKAGVLLPEHISMAALQGTRYDDELNVGSTA
jgi:hypothetical protein